MVGLVRGGEHVVGAMGCSTTAAWVGVRCWAAVGGGAVGGEVGSPCFEGASVARCVGLGRVGEGVGLGSKDWGIGGDA